jgi:hypothetical protein
MTTRELTWEDAVVAVMADEGKALHYADIAERIMARGLRGPVANPAAVVRRVLGQSIRDGHDRFQRTNDGEYILREILTPAPLLPRPKATPEPSTDDVDDTDAGAIQALGMFWRREAVLWSRAKPSLWGHQSAGAQSVDFAGQVGVYLLHDRDRTIYVGRAADALHTRLRAHTIDRLAGRWDRFSWFGLRKVSDDGSLANPSVAWTHNVVIESLEAVLIEAMEPPLNRKRGDNFAGVEYLQVDDPAIDEARKKQVLSDVLKAAGM